MNYPLGINWVSEFINSVKYSESPIDDVYQFGINSEIYRDFFETAEKSMIEGLIATIVCS